MCKHVLNAQVSIRAPCCRRWFDCPVCHEETADHPLLKTTEMVFACKKCKKVFRKDITTFEEADEYCPHCDNHYILPAETPESKGQIMVELEGDEQLIKDDRVKQRRPRDDPSLVVELDPRLLGSSSSSQQQQ
eukprot:TRINITY_DN16984_c0_g1_i1.p1 TRINITY_DN16984_c0_g1~~TRINITY_DN16984_c0_g1_i1.p1  ORF type:complete len:133 (-),score=26.90 TRINITY_DN16984_c0_g1_i1:24-422(-)